jgi:hypothetical protein
VYAESPGFDAVSRLGGKWIVHIPCGQLRMRTDYTVVQQQGAVLRQRILAIFS